ncbi:hypothetical protein JEU11_20635 [Paraglaciecola chathamensis]|uniref:Uncharacterized protein n=1 Tax=Paraglaciecola chathamensis TaxID=368405 RepID=A0ABS0WKB5_9ALTE|nr:hypothetical protein [Paraglaciecola chathamensis]MBJ2138858.1 hypothetical protein [Paraglaciecola chathamensis]
MFKSNALLLTSFFIASFSSIAAQTAHERSLSVALTNSTAIVNASAPLLIDEETRMDSAATFKNFIIYNNSMVNYAAAELDVTLFDALIQETVIDPLCANENLTDFKDLGVVMVYPYLGKNGEFITEQSKDMKTCDEDI